VPTSVRPQQETDGTLKQDILGEFSEAAIYNEWGAVRRTMWKDEASYSNRGSHCLKGVVPNNWKEDS
jgi:hypothetical protein